MDRESYVTAVKPGSWYLYNVWTTYYTSLLAYMISFSLLLDRHARMSPCETYGPLTAYDGQ